MSGIRIAMVVFSYYPQDTRARRAAEAIVKTGMSVDAISLRGEGQSRKERINGVNVYRINVKRKRARRLGYLWEYGLFIASAFLKLSFLHLIKRYKIIHVHTLPDILVLSAVFAKMMGARVLLDIHDIMPEFYMRKYGIPETHKMIKLIKYLEKLSIKFADHVVIASPLFRETVIKRSSAPDKCTTIMNLPDPKYFHAIIVGNCHDDDKFKVIYPGTLSEIHGVDIAIKAIERIAKRTNIPIQFHIYGAGAELERNKLITLTKKLDLHNFVYFQPSVPLEKLAGIYKSMYVGVVPKRNGIFADDAISTKLFEFAAVELPAIVSRTKSDSLYFDDSMVMFFEPENEKELADCIIKLYRNPRLGESLCQQSRLLCRKINWETEKIKLYTVYERMLLL